MSHKVSSCEVIVVGGGVIGAACARAAALRGLRVALCEPGPDRAAASRASAGLLAAQIEPPDEWLRGLAVRGRDLYEGLADARRLGVTMLSERVVRVVIASGRATGVALADRTLDAEHVVIAAGAWSPQIGGLPRPLPIEPIRGQMAAAPWPSGTPPAILYCDHSYVLARGGEALMGSTMEHAGFDGRVTEAGIAEIVSGAARLLPALATVRPARTWAGLRPVTPDGRPIVGADPETRGLWFATGHGRNGILLAALTGDVIGDLLAGGATDVD